MNKYNIMKIFEIYDDLITPEEEDITRHYLKNRPHGEDKYETEEEEYDAIGNSVESLKDKLAKIGWRCIGNGAFSLVFGNMVKPYVLKVTYESDPGYAEYVNLIHNHPNKYFPQISDMKILKVYDEEYHIYLIEKLKRIDFENAMPYLQFIRKVIAEYQKPISEIFPNGVPKNIVYNKELVKAIKLIRIHSRNTGYFIDMSSNNIMQRTDGTIVITDPYSWGSTPSGNEERYED